MQLVSSRSNTTRSSGLSPDWFFEVKVRPSRERVIVAPSGELDCATVDRVESAIDGLVADGWRAIVLDLRGLSFLDSTGLCAIMRQTDRSDVAVQVIDGAATVSRVFDLAGLRKVVPFVTAGDLRL